tara:strand:+ start:4408 stop:4653 length:246 start_codon:yes stop_codon:yes gene_type:complete
LVYRGAVDGEEFAFRFPNPIHPLGNLPEMTEKESDGDYEFRLARLEIRPEHWGLVASAGVFIRSNGVTVGRISFRKRCSPT